MFTCDFEHEPTIPGGWIGRYLYDGSDFRHVGQVERFEQFDLHIDAPFENECGVDYTEQQFQRSGSEDQMEDGSTSSSALHECESVGQLGHEDLQHSFWIVQHITTAGMYNAVTYQNRYAIPIGFEGLKYLKVCCSFASGFREAHLFQAGV